MLATSKQFSAFFNNFLHLFFFNIFSSSSPETFFDDSLILVIIFRHWSISDWSVCHLIVRCTLIHTPCIIEFFSWVTNQLIIYRLLLDLRWLIVCLNRIFLNSLCIVTLVKVWLQLISYNLIFILRQHLCYKFFIGINKILLKGLWIMNQRWMLRRLSITLPWRYLALVFTY